MVEVLERLRDRRGLPRAIVADNGLEFAGRALDLWAHERGLKIDYIRPGKPVDNAFVESFNARFRDECLNESWFLSLQEAREGDRDLARGLQRSAAAQCSGRPLTERVRSAHLNPGGLRLSVRAIRGAGQAGAHSCCTWAC